MKCFKAHIVFVCILAFHAKVYASNDIIMGEQKSELIMNPIVEIYETVDFWKDDVQYKFLTVVLRLNSTNRKKLKGSALLGNNIHVRNDLWLEDDNCKKRALKVIEVDMGDFIEIRGLFLIDDLASFSNKFQVFHQTDITNGNRGQTNSFMNSYGADLKTIEIKRLESTVPLANKDWYHEWNIKNPKSRDNRFRIASSNEQCE